MPFDPSLPVNGSEVASAELRGQFNGLKALIDAVPAGPTGSAGEKGDKGDPGDAGPAGNNGADGQPGPVGEGGPEGPAGRAIVGIRDNGDGRALIDMSDGTTYGPYIIASGPAGPPGPNGGEGPAGPSGGIGPEGRHVVNIIDTGDGRGTIVMSDGSQYGPYILASGPGGPSGPQGGPGEKGDRGDTGAGEPGPAGAPGPNFTMRGDWQAWNGYNGGDVVAYNGNLYVSMADGLSGPPPDQDARWKLLTLTGPQGQPGEVTNQQMTDAVNNALATTPTNCNTVATLSLTVSDPDMQAIANKLDELISALRR